MKLRELKFLPPAPFSDDYARLIGQNWDYWQEWRNLEIPAAFYDRLDRLQKEARSLDPNGDTGVSLNVGGMPFQVGPYGARGGTQYVLKSPDFLILLRSANCPFNVGVRISASALWQYGLSEILQRVAELIPAIGRYRDPEDQRPRVSRCDYAFDIYSPGFTREMTPDVIRQFYMPHPGKHRAFGEFEAFGKANRIETIVVGRLPRLQLTIYDKGREITEISGKDWMRDAWKIQSGFITPKMLADIWRVEIRFGKEYLKIRNLRFSQDIISCLPGMIAGALADRQLVASGPTMHLGGRLHPLWQIVHDASGNAADARAVGPMVTGRRDAMRKILRDQISGSLISSSVIEEGAFDPGTVRDLAAQAAEQAISETSKIRDRKVKRAMERYATVRTK